MPVLIRIYDARDVGHQYTYGEILGMSSENIRKDLLSAEGGRGIWVFFGGAGILLIACGLLLPKALGGMALTFGILALIVGVVFGNRYRKRCARIADGEYTACTAWVTGKEIETDSDGPDTYYIQCTDGEKNWKTRVEYGKYRAVRKGARVRCVFFDNPHQPAVTYWNIG